MVLDEVNEALLLGLAATQLHALFFHFQNLVDDLLQFALLVLDGRFQFGRDGLALLNGLRRLVVLLLQPGEAVFQLTLQGFTNFFHFGGHIDAPNIFSKD